MWACCVSQFVPSIINGCCSKSYSFEDQSIASLLAGIGEPDIRSGVVDLVSRFGTRSLSLGHHQPSPSPSLQWWVVQISLHDCSDIRTTETLCIDPAFPLFPECKEGIKMFVSSLVTQIWNRCGKLKTGVKSTINFLQELLFLSECHSQQFSQLVPLEQPNWQEIERLYVLLS